jgi:hypothetical protein
MEVGFCLWVFVGEVGGVSILTSDVIFEIFFSFCRSGGGKSETYRVSEAGVGVFQIDVPSTIIPPICVGSFLGK